MQIDFGSSILPKIPSLYPLPASAEQSTKLYAPPEASNNRFFRVASGRMYVVELRSLVDGRYDAGDDFRPSPILRLRAAVIRASSFPPRRIPAGMGSRGSWRNGSVTR